MARRGVDRTPYPAALRLYAIAEQRWAEVEASYATVDLFHVGPRKFLNLIFAWCVQRIDPDKREEWEVDLESPLPGREKAKPSERTIEREGADFMAAMMQHQGG